MKRGVILLILSIGLLGCQSMGPYERTGTVMGTVAGGLIGGSFGHGLGSLVGAGVGGVVGGVLGNSVGQTFDSQYVDQDADALRMAGQIPVGESVSWCNRRTGDWGCYTPIRDGHSNYGSYCREYVYVAQIHGKPERMTGIACRHPNGTWYRY